MILLAVVLFAALSYAVTQSTRGGGNSASAEKLQTAAAEIINYATLVEQTVTRLRLSGGCKDTEISFLYDFDGDGVVENNVDDQFHNPNAPGDKHCHVFDPAGGGLSVKPKLSTEYLQSSGWANNGTVNGWQTTFAGKPIFIYGDLAGTSEHDLMLVIPFISDDLCHAINRKLNGQDRFLWGAGYWYIALWRGSFTNVNISTWETKPYNTGCTYKYQHDAYNQYYNLLIAR